MDNDFALVKVSRISKPAKVAGAIAKFVRSGTFAEIRSVGAGATNQAVKAIALATQFLEEDGLKLRVEVRFVTLQGDSGALSGLCFITQVDVMPFPEMETKADQQKRLLRRRKKEILP